MDNTELERLEGDVESIVYRNDENGYTVLELDCDGELVTAVGNMPLVAVGESLSLLGVFTNHSSYGMQFSVRAFERSMPVGAASILKYLSSRAIKGVGPSTAKKLVEQFGDSTLDVIENEPQRLTAIKGITLEKAQRMSEELQGHFGIRQLMVKLQTYGVPPQSIVSLWREYGKNALTAIEENPYILCSEQFSIPFESADKIAQKQEKAADNIFRIEAGLFHILEHNKLNGHTCLPKDRLLQACSTFLELPLDKCTSCLENMLLSNTLFSHSINGREFIFTPQMYECELYVAARLNAMLRCPPSVISGVEMALDKIEISEKIEYAALQRQAVTEAASKGLLVLTGGPGTGKTTTLNAIIKILKMNGERVFLAAPTGRAAQRMSEVTGEEAKTIHRLLEVSWDNRDRPVFKRNESNPLRCDALIIDEVSMVDSALFFSVMQAVPMGCRIILVGDSDQLPSVGAGNVLSDLIESYAVPVVQLNEIFRQSMKSLIVTNAHRIVKGEMPILNETKKDFFFMQRINKELIAKTIIDLCKTRLPHSYGFSPLDDIQVLCPGKKGVLGTFDLNERLQAALNPADELKPELVFNNKVFRQGDKVMQIKNNYDIPWTRDDGEMGEGIFNGDVGILTRVNKSSKSVEVRFDDKTAKYHGDDLLHLELAYAATVHKSQGNEFNAVVIPMHKGAPQLYYRNLLYTAVTRAKSLLILVGDPSVVEYMVKNNRRTLRYSGLKCFLLEGLQ
ncbi:MULTISPECIES: ATP-dependent RecD-like DNA helicase [unclassified Ruminococcus]|uniref:SF1B family DNA helicase RecD2 n=1 Tax=unclassified Ruminococcus TaxID=2608920 RepID=UPI00210CF45D|nr:MULTISPECIES: ATP-dependent RecD-like DNA helicase [unclassified Ruminococcus]MCQ4022964.1 ATP-dependent RecD-like DNA helicase [Ruminococcus sp. zg-924]MCQ4115338.1 ATP-dependent RecD-like DNA helicase [Ruminococcus sp. zg-921]